MQIPWPAESSLRPTEMSVLCVSSAAIASIFEPKRLQRIGGTARSTMSGQKGGQRLEATLSERRHCGIFVGAARPTREDCCRSRRCHAPLLSFAGANALSAPWLHAHLFDVESSDQWICKGNSSRAPGNWFRLLSAAPQHCPQTLTSAQAVQARLIPGSPSRPEAEGAEMFRDHV